MTTDTHPLAPTDSELIAELGAAGVEFMAFRGGLCGTKEVWVTAGSQDAKKIAQGVRAALAKWGAPQPVAREPLSAEQYNILVEDLSEWSRHVEVDTAPRSLEEHIHQVFAIHGIKGGQHGTE